MGRRLFFFFFFFLFFLQAGLTVYSCTRQSSLNSGGTGFFSRGNYSLMEPVKHIPFVDICVLVLVSFQTAPFQTLISRPPGRPEFNGLKHETAIKSTFRFTGTPFF
jgi:hypothetical protein